MARSVTLLHKVIGAVAFLFLLHYLFWSRTSHSIDGKASLESDIFTLTRRRDQLSEKIAYLERQKHRMELKMEKLEYQ